MATCAAISGFATPTLSTSVRVVCAAEAFSGLTIDVTSARKINDPRAAAALFIGTIAISSHR
jgi:hypothetical protein